MDKESLRGSLARGYCTKRSGKKVLDPDLIEDMVVEVEKLMDKTYEDVTCKSPTGVLLRVRRILRTKEGESIVIHAEKVRDLADLQEKEK